MPLQFATPPADSNQALTRGLQQVAQAASGGMLGGASALTAGSSKKLEPHQVFELSLSDLAAQRGFEAARPVSWRYLIVSNQRVVQAAEVLSSPQGGASQFGALTTGHTRGVEDAFHQAEQLPEVQRGPYEIRALRVPALYVMAIWLKDLQGTADRFLLLPPVFEPFKTRVVYDRGDLLAVMHRVAAQRMAQEQKLAAEQKLMSNPP